MEQNPTSNGTLAELTANLSTIESRLGSEQTSLARVQSNYASITDRALYSTDAAHKASFEEHLPGLAEAEATALQVAQLARTQARQIFSATETELPQLTDEEYKVAGGRASLIKEDAETLRLDELTRRTRQALLVADRPGQFLYARYGKQRLASGKDNLEEHLKPKAELGAVIREIEGRLIPGSVKKAHDRAVELLGKASKLESQAAGRRRSQERFTFKNDRDVAWE